MILFYVNPSIFKIETFVSWSSTMR